MQLYQVNDETVKKLEVVAEALGVKYHDEAIEVLISTAHRVTVNKPDEGKRFDDDPWTDAVLGFINGRDFILRDELIAALGVEMKNYKRSEANRIGAIMKVSGYERFRVGRGIDRGKYAFRRKER